MYEIVGLAILLAGSILVTFGLLWLIRLAWRQRKLVGIATVVTVPVGPLVYGLSRFRDSRFPLLLILCGVVLGAVPFGYERAHEYFFGLGERERLIEGERHLVLTGWDRPDYNVLRAKTDVVVLEMGNANVSDATLELLPPLTKLRELTLNDSGVSDAGLATLKKLPALQSLRLARTKITKEGVSEFLSAPPEKLQEIDVSGNSIPASALRKWKNQDPEHRRYVN